MAETVIKPSPKLVDRLLKILRFFIEVVVSVISHCFAQAVLNFRVEKQNMD